MKLFFIKTRLVIILFLMTILSCTNKEVNDEKVNAKRIEEAFYKPKVNTFNNEERKIVFNTDLLKSEEMEYLKNHQIKKFINFNFNKIAGVSIYYDNAELNKNVEYSDLNILAIIIYELDENELMKNHFFVKNKENKFIQKLSLFENMMSTTNQVFLIYKYFPNLYKNQVIGINTLRDVNLDNQKILAQKNEFDLFRVVNTFQNIKFNSTVYRVGDEDAFFRGVICQNCAETWYGICDAGLYCNVVDDNDAEQDETITDGDENSACEDKERRYKSFVSGGLSQTVAESLFDLQLHRNLRDNLMKNYNIGEKYIAYYYALCGFLQSQDYQPETLAKMISTLPEFNQSIEKLLQQGSNGSEIIITESLKNDMFAIIADLKNISTNQYYRYILNDLENDLNAIQNKTKDQLMNELN